MTGYKTLAFSLSFFLLQYLYSICLYSRKVDFLGEKNKAFPKYPKLEWNIFPNTFSFSVSIGSSWFCEKFSGYMCVRVHAYARHIGSQKQQMTFWSSVFCPTARKMVFIQRHIRHKSTCVGLWEVTLRRVSSQAWLQVEISRVWGEEKEKDQARCAKGEWSQMWPYL